MVSPKVSTMGSLFTMALFCTILITPSASVTVTTMGSPSGMAATARLEETAGFDKQNHQMTSPGPAEPEWGVPDSNGEHVQDPLPLQPAHQHDHT